MLSHDGIDLGKHFVRMHYENMVFDQLIGRTRVTACMCLCVFQTLLLLMSLCACLVVGQNDGRYQPEVRTTRRPVPRIVGVRNQGGNDGRYAVYTHR